MDQDTYYKKLMTMLATPVVQCCGYDELCECHTKHIPETLLPDVFPLYEDENSGI